MNLHLAEADHGQLQAPAGQGLGRALGPREAFLHPRGGNDDVEPGLPTLHEVANLFHDCVRDHRLVGDHQVIPHPSS